MCKPLPLPSAWYTKLEHGVALWGHMVMLFIYDANSLSVGDCRTAFIVSAIEQQGIAVLDVESWQ